jgi:hypothetical protein
LILLAGVGHGGEYYAPHAGAQGAAVFTAQQKRQQIHMRASLILAIIGAISCSTAGRSQTLDLQAMCAEQARKVFQEWKHEFNKNKFGITLFSSDYQSHYNTKLKKCLVLIHSSSNIGKQIHLTDAFERTFYAAYHWVSEEGKKFWEVPPRTCDLAASYREKKNCTTREEFDAFVAEFMEE